MSAIRRSLGPMLLIACAAALVAAPALAAAPAVGTGVASSVTYQSATLNGRVDPGREPTEVYFQYGTTGEYGSQSAPTQLPAGAATVAVAIPIGGLTAATRYHYRLVATNATRTSLGADRTFTTAKIPLSLAITAAPNPVAFGGSVTIEGTLSGTGAAGALVQLEQSQFPYTSGFVPIGNPEVTFANGTFAFNELGLGLNTQYRVVSGAVASAPVSVAVAVAVTLSAHRAGTRRHPLVHFAGTIAPAEPSARVAFERLSGSRWRVFGGTIARSRASNGISRFAKTVRVHGGGFFRALVLPVEGAHVSGYSQTVLVRVR